jgi:hypothetical protein
MLCTGANFVVSDDHKWMTTWWSPWCMIRMYLTTVSSSTKMNITSIFCISFWIKEQKQIITPVSSSTRLLAVVSPCCLRCYALINSITLIASSGFPSLTPALLGSTSVSIWTKFFCWKFTRCTHRFQPFICSKEVNRLIWWGYLLPSEIIFPFSSHTSWLNSWHSSLFVHKFSFLFFA